jgi:hypothetical protein
MGIYDSPVTHLPTGEMLVPWPQFARFCAYAVFIGLCTLSNPYFAFGAYSGILFLFFSNPGLLVKISEI